MTYRSIMAIAICAMGTLCFAAVPSVELFKLATKPATAPATKPVLKIIPGKVIVPTDNMRRPWGELISLDPATRTGKFRKDGTDEIFSFTILPYAELLHHAAFGDLQDFRVGERLIFRLHPNEAGEWVWLTYIQDEMNMMNGHKEYFHVDAIAADKGQLTCTQANADMSFVRSKEILLETDAETRYWKEGRPAKFADIKVGDKLRTKTHGVGKGASRVCWEVFLDDASLLKCQTEQKAVHAKRIAELGAPAYVDSLDSGKSLELTIFQEGGDVAKALRAGQKVSLSPAGLDRKPSSERVSGKVTAAKMAGNLGKVSVAFDGAVTGFTVGAVVRVWPVP